MNFLKKLSEKRIQKKLNEFNQSGMLRYFHYDFGSMRGDRDAFTVQSLDEGVILTVQKIHYENGETETSEYELPPVIMQQIKQLLRENSVFLWKGFDKHNTMIEGDAFVLDARFDNYNLRAEGASMLPTGFYSVNETIISFFKELIEGV